MNKFILIGILGAAFTGCSSNNTKSEKSSIDSLRNETQAAVQTFQGVYEYSSPSPDGYLYYKLELHPDGNGFKGTLNAGNYLATSEAGGYVNPNALLDCDAIGEVDKDQLILTLTVTKADTLEAGAPDLTAVMNFPMLDTDVNATAWTLSFENKRLVSQNGRKNADGTLEKLNWEKLK